MFTRMFPCNVICVQVLEAHFISTVANKLSFCRPPENMSSATRDKFDPGGVADFRLAVWQRLEEPQPEHIFYQQKKCLKEIYYDQLHQSYLNELRKYHCCPLCQDSCEGRHCLPPCTKQDNYVLFHRGHASSISQGPNQHHHHHQSQQQLFHDPQCHRHQPNRLSPQHTHYQYQNLAEDLYTKQLREHYLKQTSRQHTRRIQQYHQQKPTMGTRQGSVYNKGMEYCMMQFPTHQHDTENWAPLDAHCDSDARRAQCPYQLPRDIMEPRQYLLTSATWKGVPVPFSDPRYEPLLPGNRDPLSLLPSSNPFAYVGRKSNWTEPRLQDPPTTALPITAKRPEVFGDGTGVALTTNRLGYRPQRRHFTEIPSMIVYN